MEPPGVYMLFERLEGVENLVHALALLSVHAAETNLGACRKVFEARSPLFNAA